MRFSAKRVLLAGALAVSAIAVPVTAAVVGSGGGVANAAPQPTPDTIKYVEGTTSSGSPTYSFVYTPGNGSAPSTQTLVPGGAPCYALALSGTSSGGTVSSGSSVGSGFLGLSGLLYPSSDYSGTPSTAPVGARYGHTGVCALGPPQQINNTVPPPTGALAEELDVAVGGSSTIGANRLFSKAVLDIRRKGNSPYVAGKPAPMTVRLLESYAGTLVASQTCTITGGDNTDIFPDTSLPAGPPCTGTAATTPFDTLAIQELTVGGSIAVVGTSTFTLANQLCSGGSVTSSGSVSATLSVPGGSSGCESYSAFTSITDPATGQTTLNFDAHSSTPNTPFTIHVPWNPQAACQPGQPTSDTTPTALPVCPPTQVSVNGQPFTDQTYCVAASPADPLCTTNKAYNFVADPGTGNPMTQITEDWAGIQDWSLRH